MLSLTTFRTAFSFHPSGPFLATFHYRLPKVTKVLPTVTNAPSHAAARGAHRVFNRCSDVMKYNVIATVVCPAICIACGCERNYASVIINLFKICVKYSLFALWTRFVRFGNFASSPYLLRSVLFHSTFVRETAAPSWNTAVPVFILRHSVAMLVSVSVNHEEGENSREFKFNLQTQSFQTKSCRRPIDLSSI